MVYLNLELTGYGKKRNEVNKGGGEGGNSKLR